MTSSMALDTLRMFQAAGMDVSGETCPQYLWFTEEALSQHGAYAKINPPLRTKSDQEALWQALGDGTLLAVTTDHSPFTVEEKERARDDIWAAPPGAPGIEELVPGMLHAVAEGRLTLEQAVALMSTPTGPSASVSIRARAPSSWAPTPTWCSSISMPPPPFVRMRYAPRRAPATVSTTA